MSNETIQSPDTDPKWYEPRPELEREAPLDFSEAWTEYETEYD